MVSFLMGDLAGLSAGLTSAEDTKAWSSFLGDVRQDESAADGILSSSHARHVDTNTNAKPSLSLVVGNSPSASSSSSFVERHVPLVKDRSSDLLNKGHLVGSSKAAGLSARSHIEEATGSPLVPKSASSSFLQYNHSDAVSSTTSSGGLHLLHDHDSARAGHTDLSSPSGSSALMRLAHGHELSSTDHDILRHHIQVLARGQHAHPHDTSFLLMGSGNSTISRAAAAYPMPTDFSALSLKDLFYVAKTGFLLFGGLCSKMFGMGLIGFLAFQSMTAPKSELPRPYTAYYPQPVLYPHVYSVTASPQG
ncbi:unnamed protein product [Amoebophrya sp. A25]|nr:unnamed protein product [Amoebophrya sp. A25]|eukprot:GSA25T00024320001.1